MGLFSKKNDGTIRVSDLFTPEDLATVRNTVAAKKGNYSKQIQPWIEAFLKATENGDAVLDKATLRQAVFAAGVFAKMEPTLSPILIKAIQTYQAMK